MPHFMPIAGIALALLPCAAWAQAPPEPAAPLRLTLQDAMARAQKYSQTAFNANIEALLAREDTKQAKAALLPTVNGFSQYIYTQANGSPTGTFVPNDGVHVYNTTSPPTPIFTLPPSSPITAAPWPPRPPRTHAPISPPAASSAPSCRTTTPWPLPRARCTTPS